MASVNGRRIMKLVPCPVTEEICSDPPTGRLGYLVRGAESGRQDQLHNCVIGNLAVGLQQPLLERLAANRLDVETSAVIGDVNHHFRALPVQAYGDSTGGGLARCLAGIRIFDAMHNGIAHHVFERWQHLVEHLPIQLAGSTFNRKLRTFARLSGGLPHQPGQTGNITLERHHARQRLQQTFQAVHVIRGLGEGARELLNHGVAIHLERIEVLGHERVLVAVHDLRLGFVLEFAQLFAQAGNSLFHFLEVKLDRIDLLAETGVVDADFTRRIKQIFKELRIDTGEFLALIGSARLRA
jgi:hypothetical protein